MCIVCIFKKETPGVRYNEEDIDTPGGSVYSVFYKYTNTSIYAVL